MIWMAIALLGSSLYILLMIIPHTLLALLTRSGNLPHLDARIWARWSLFCSGTRVEVEGLENLPAGPAVYMANHQSYFDIPAILANLPIQFRWIVKQELASIPFFGLAMKGAGYIMIDRSDHEAALESLRRAGRIIAGGTSVFIFPEGTRSETGEMRYPLKKGGFYLALQAGVPVVPITITGAIQVHTKGSRTLQPGTIRVKVGQPISPAGHSAASLMDAVHWSISRGLPDTYHDVAA